jgi:hypothetical protein
MTETGPSDTAKPSGTPTAEVGDDKEPRPTRSAEQIQADIDAAQLRLADQVDTLSERLAPQSLAEDAIERMKRVFVEEDGTPKRKPIGIAVGTVAGLLLLRKLFHR